MKSRLPRLLFRFVVFLLLLSGSVLAYVSHQGVQALLYPRRTLIDDYHRKVLAAPAAFGFNLTSFTVSRPDGVKVAANYITPVAGKLPEVQADFQKKLGAAGLGGMLEWDQPRGTLLLLHGRNSCKEHWFPVVERLARMGLNIILLDNRGHGQTEGGYCTFGGTEATDVRAVLDEVASRWGLPEALGVMGYSLGGATAVSLLPQEPRIKSAVLISVFADLEEIIERPARGRFGSLAGLAMPLVRLETRCRAGFLLDEICPCEIAPQVTVPTLMVHGSLDQFVPIDHGRRILTALGSKQTRLLEIPTAAHADVLLKGGNNLYVETAAFFKETLLSRPE